MHVRELLKKYLPTSLMHLIYLVKYRSKRVKTLKQTKTEKEVTDTDIIILAQKQLN